MPMYWGDYLADTHHFTNAQHGSYLLLIGYYWCNGALPADEDDIRKIAKCEMFRWPKLRKLLIQKFSLVSYDNGPPVWKHMRIDRELAKCLEKSRVNSANAKRSRAAVADVSLTHSQSPSQSSKKERSYNEVSCETGVKTPRHGVRSADGRFVYFKRDTDEFAAYVNDYLEGTGDEPNATADGRWFKVYGEEQQVAEKGKSNGVSSELEATVKARGWA
jgi:uncharacterized protein YdaU (DUF1376 family)